MFGSSVKCWGELLMEDRRDLQINTVRQSSLRSNGVMKSALLSGKTTPRGSPSFRRTPRRDGRGGGWHFQWIRSNKLLLWLILITLWAYLGFFVQSKWAHGDNNNKEAFVGYRSKASDEVSYSKEKQPSDMVGNGRVLIENNATSGSRTSPGKKGLDLSNTNVSLGKNGSRASSRKNLSVKKTKRSKRRRGRSRGKAVVNHPIDSLEEQEEEIPKRNSSYGQLLGPFGSTEDKILGWTAEKRSGTCDRTAEFARLVWSRKFVLVFHELSMTGAPLSMLELATELLSCGATVSAVVLNRRGGLMTEINRRKIKVIEDKTQLSFKTAMRADLVIAGSAVCASWIEQYLAHFTAGSNQIAWWIMENRREYFDRAKLLLNRVKTLIFLSESQSKQWLTWSEEEGIRLNSQPALLPLSVNDELAFVAGIPSSLNTPSFGVEQMLERRRLLRHAVREEMGLTDNDMLVMSLSSINAGKGQQLLLEAANLVIEKNLSREDSKSKIKEETHSGIAVKQNQTSKEHPRALFQNAVHDNKSNKSSVLLNSRKRKSSGSRKLIPSKNHTNKITMGSTQTIRKVLSDNGETQEKTVKVLVGSVGSKSNKVVYVKGLLSFLSEHPKLSKAVLWTPATTHVAALYSAADVYVINSQGLGETFGRVTVEAMAFGLPVLGTEAGGTKEIVEHNITGLLHPVGRPGIEVLAQNIQFLLENSTAREQMGVKGRSKVEKIYLKQHMYKQFALVLLKCLKLR